MRTVFVHRDSTVVGHKMSILEGAGIDCFIQNESTSALGAGFLGLVQSPIFEPALCIIDDSRYEEALALLKMQSETSPDNEAEWRCPKCGEIVPGNFADCWSCSSHKPEKVL